MPSMHKFKNLILSLKNNLGLFKKENSLRIGKIQGSLFGVERLTDSELNHHVHIIGASGFGKTVLLTKILKDQISRGRGALWLDMKGDMETTNEMISLIERLGRKDDLKVFSLNPHKLRSNYNLLSIGNSTELRDRIIGSLNWSEEFYKNQSMSYLLKLLTGLVWLRDQKGEYIDLAKVYQGTTNPDFIFSLIEKIPNSELKIKTLLEECYQFISKKESLHNLSGLNSQLESLLLSDFGKDLNESKDSISLFKAVQESKIIFIFLDTRRYSESAKILARMFIKDLISTSAKIDSEIPKGKRNPFVCFIDEFSDIAQEDFTAFPDRARSSKMSLVLSHQELSDLKKVSETFANRLTANMATLYAFLQSNSDSAEAISKRAGTKTVWKETIKAKKFGFISFPTEDRSLREVEEFVVHPNRVRGLGVGECVCIKKYPYARAHVVSVDEK
jgi:type IV secretory pathway TraG/TraD family ATPase VirD4